MIGYMEGPAGRLEALIDEPSVRKSESPKVRESDYRTVGLSDSRTIAQPTAAVVLAHPHPLYGGTMHTKAVFQAAKGFQRIGCAAVRFNFRGVGASEGTFDNGVGELEDFRAALDFAAKRYPGTRLWAAGMSFGSWVALTVGAEDDRVEAVLGIAPPLGMYDFTGVLKSTKPKFFIQGERDEICPLKTMREFYGRLLEPRELVVIDGADHLFDGHTTEVGEAVEDLFGDL